MNNILYFIAGLALLIVGAEFLIKEAKVLGKKLGLSDLSIGLTIVAVGTSLPEFVTSLTSVSKDKDDIAVGMVIGSNIINILLVLGLGALIYPLKFQKNVILKNWYWAFGAVCLLFFMGHDSQFSRIQGLILSALFIGFIYTLPRQRLNDGVKSENRLKLVKDIGILFLGMGMLFLGGEIFLRGIIGLMKTLDVSEAVIGLTLVGFSTNIPEIATTTASAIKRNSDILVGNILGSNIQNILMVLGGTALISPFSFANHNLIQNIYILAGVTLLLLPIILFSKQMGRIYGAFFVSGAIMFILYTFY